MQRGDNRLRLTQSCVCVCLPRQERRGLSISAIDSRVLNSSCRFLLSLCSSPSRQATSKVSIDSGEIPSSMALNLWIEVKSMKSDCKWLNVWNFLCHFSRSEVQCADSERDRAGGKRSHANMCRRRSGIVQSKFCDKITITNARTLKY